MNKNTISKENIYKKIWDICCKLRRKLDFLEIRDYIFSLMFYRYISEYFEKRMNGTDTGKSSYDYANISDEEAIQHKESQVQFGPGFFILPSQLFKNVYERAEKNEKERQKLGETLKNIFTEIEGTTKGERSSENFQNLLTGVDFLGNTKLAEQSVSRSERIFEIMKEVKSMEVEEENSDDHLGNIYEYLMSMYAANSGKKGGEFYTPAKVSELLAKIVIGDQKEIKDAYDPACGSGSLLLKIVKILGKDNVRKLCGQEINTSTYNLCRMNMFLNDIKYSKFDIKNGDTLESPSSVHGKMEFDAIVSNPPYSIRWKGEDDTKLANDFRFTAAGIMPPKSKADYAFILHCLSLLSNTGKAAIICSIGALTRSGRERDIRKWLITENFVEGVILLPANLFFGTSISTAIMVLSKNKKDRDRVFFVNASEEFVSKKVSNELSDENVEKIYNLYKCRKVIPHVTELVSRKKMEEENYDLGVITYVLPPEINDEIDISLLNENIKKTVKRINELRSEIDEIIKEIE